MGTEFFKFGPDWKTGVTETLTFLTDILITRNGTEQRRSLRTKPRRQLAYAAILRREDVHAFERFMWKHQTGLIQAPDWCCRRQLSSEVLAGATEINILAADDPKVYTFEDGQIPADMTIISGYWGVQSGGMPHPVAGEKRLSGVAFNDAISEIRLSSEGALFPAELEFSYDLYASSATPELPSFEVIVNGEVKLAVVPPGTQSSWVVATVPVSAQGDIVFRVYGHGGFANASLGHIKWAFKTPGSMADFVPGRGVALVGVAGKWASTIESISGNTITLTESVDADWPSGSSVYPMIQAALPDTLQTTFPASGVQKATITLDQVVDSLPLVKPIHSADMVIQAWFGRYVEALVRPINWAYGLTVDMAYTKGVVDGQAGPAHYEFAVRQPARALKGTVLMRSKEDVDWWKAFFNRVKGRREQFIAPTWQQDLHLVPAPEGSYAGSAFVTRGADLGLSWGDSYRSDVYTHVFVKKKDGTKGFYRIYGAYADQTSDTTTLSTENWTEDYSPAEAPFACLACCLRMASDTMTINWRTGSVAEMELAVVTAVLQQKVT